MSSLVLARASLLLAVREAAVLARGAAVADVSVLVGRRPAREGRAARVRRARVVALALHGEDATEGDVTGEDLGVSVLQHHVDVGFRAVTSAGTTTFHY